MSENLAWAAQQGVPVPWMSPGDREVKVCATLQFQFHFPQKLINIPH